MNATGQAYIEFWTNKADEYRAAVAAYKRDGMRDQERIWQHLLNEAVDNLVAQDSEFDLDLT